MSMIAEKDFGTPASPSTHMVNLEIDGFQVIAPAGTSVMRRRPVSELISLSYARPTALSHSALAAYVWWKSRAVAGCPLPAPHP